MRYLPLLLSCAGALLLSACDKEKEVDPPAELVEFEPRLNIDKVWGTGIDGDSEQMRLGLRPIVEAGRLYAASHDGDVYSFDLKTGKVNWKAQTKLRLSGGPGLGAERLFVGSSDGDVLALNAADGKELWRISIPGEVIAPPAATDAIAVVRTVDGRLRGLSTADGRELWVAEQQVPRLSLRGTAPPVIIRDMVVCGFDNGKVLAVGLKDGNVVWETTVAPSRGRTELERLVDIDSSVQVEGDDVFVVGFQGRAAMLALDSGQIWWSRDASSDRGLVVGSDAVYVAGADGDVVALNRRDGTPLWTQAGLHRRGLSSPALDGSTLVLADFEGYVHWLDAATGDFLGRTKTDGSRVTNAPLTADDLVVVLTDGGSLNVYRRKDRAPRSSG
ncbi:MAG TPA: outer membrane protein assembly factor BamB [Steroidobacteraceae bacterium]|nr:outer membrane protein assembly factor BamB [Steroidobacteraceae bacterium]